MGMLGTRSRKLNDHRGMAIAYHDLGIGEQGCTEHTCNDDDATTYTRAALEEQRCR